LGARPPRQSPIERRNCRSVQATTTPVIALTVLTSAQHLTILTGVIGLIERVANRGFTLYAGASAACLGSEPDGRSCVATKRKSGLVAIGEHWRSVDCRSFGRRQATGFGKIPSGGDDITIPVGAWTRGAGRDSQGAVGVGVRVGVWGGGGQATQRFRAGQVTGRSTWMLAASNPARAAASAALGRAKNGETLPMVTESQRIDLALAGKAPAAGSVERCGSFPQAFPI
jgi:hypothetical protein